MANPDTAVFTLAAESTWTIAGNASLLWAIPFTNNSFGITMPDATGTANFSGWSNGSGMVNLTERTDDSTTAGNGGALGIATAHFAPAGVSYGRMNVTLAVPSYKCFAVSTLTWSCSTAPLAM